MAAFSNSDNPESATEMTASHRCLRPNPFLILQGPLKKILQINVQCVVHIGWTVRFGQHLAKPLRILAGERTGWPLRSSRHHGYADFRLLISDEAHQEEKVAL